QILVSGGTAGGLAGLAAGHPGWHVASRSVANAAAAQAAQDGFANNLILGLVATLAAVALVNTLVVATVERRRALRLLGRVGASRGQVAASFGWHALFVTVTGVVAGMAAGAVTLVAGAEVVVLTAGAPSGTVSAVAGAMLGPVFGSGDDRSLAWERHSDSVFRALAGDPATGVRLLTGRLLAAPELGPGLPPWVAQVPG